MKEDVLDFIYRLGEFQVRVGLATTKEFMQILGNPYRHQKIIHIAGTNGKGSTISFLEKFLLDSGFVIGTTISPHLLSYRERFRFQGKPISNQELNKVFEEICIKCNIHCNVASENWLVQPTFFEFSIGLAFYWFQKKKPDFILLETGMGGRLDSTNVIEQSLICGFTPISFDHSEFLGNALEAIANEKFGIVKSNSKIVCGKQEKNIQTMLKKKFPNHKKFLLDEDFWIDKNQSKPMFKTIIGNEKIIIPLQNLGLAGEHQLENAALALAIYLQIVPSYKRLSRKKIADSLSNTYWEGRLQYLKNTCPQILLEAAHNEQGFQKLGEYLKKYHKEKILCIIHWLKEKNILNALKNWDLAGIDFLVVDFIHPKANEIKNIYQVLSQVSDNILPSAQLGYIVQNYKRKNFNCYDLVLVTGSIYLLGEFCSILIKQEILSKSDFYGI